jgi:hypothetical protein
VSAEALFDSRPRTLFGEDDRVDAELAGNILDIVQCKSLESWKVDEKRDFVAPTSRDGEEVSLRRPTASQERSGKKERRPAPFEMTCGPGLKELGVSCGL